MEDYKIIDKENRVDAVFFADDDLSNIDINEYNEMSEDDKKVYCKKVSDVVGCEPDELFLYLTEVLS